MDQLVVLLAPLAALLPSAGPGDPVREVPGMETAGNRPSAALFPPPPQLDPGVADSGIPLPIADSVRVPVENQVRIEQRITIRIAPRGSAQRPLAMGLPDPASARITERSAGKCLPIAGIAGVQVGRDNRLMAFMRDRRVLALGLEKGCRAREFYSGFYVERSTDGQLCVNRDRLQSRSGANCALTRLRQLIEE